MAEIQANVDLDAPVWGTVEIGKIVNLSPRQAHHALIRGYLPADKVGRRWVSTPRRLRTRFAGEPRAW
jgi:hypothetical protein